MVRPEASHNSRGSVASASFSLVDWSTITRFITHASQEPAECNFSTIPGKMEDVVALRPAVIAAPDRGRPRGRRRRAVGRGPEPASTDDRIATVARLLS